MHWKPALGQTLSSMSDASAMTGSVEVELG